MCILAPRADRVNPRGPPAPDPAPPAGCLVRVVTPGGVTLEVDAPALPRGEASALALALRACLARLPTAADPACLRDAWVAAAGYGPPRRCRVEVVAPAAPSAAAPNGWAVVPGLGLGPGPPDRVPEMVAALSGGPAV